MARTIEKIEYDLEKARRDRDAWQTTRGGEHNYAMAKIYVSALEKELSEALNAHTNPLQKDS
ncbi:hypothetical protein ACCY16_00055 [Candidatus Pantoea formicae]|uniref:hypothetical protein n=1 Tax=Candidatus Pantoea formicae TaxID=2608355 RepID=UPI003ED9F342